MKLKGLSGSFENVGSSMSGLVPVFIRGGKMVFQQEDVDDVQSTEDLDNNLKLICALTPSKSPFTSSCEGNLALLNDYSDSSVITNCVDKNCIV